MSNPIRLMLSCDNCRRKKIKCNGDKPTCQCCQKQDVVCHYSPLGPRKKPRKPSKKRKKSAASSLPSTSDDDEEAETEVASISHLMSEHLKSADTPDAPQIPHASLSQMLRLQQQISQLVDQLRTLTLQIPGSNQITSPPEEAATKPLLDLQPPPDLISHLISVYFEFCHPTETGMYPLDLYRTRLERSQVPDHFLFSVLAVASRLSEDPRVLKQPAYLSGHHFFDHVTRHLMMDILERDCLDNILTLNNLAIYAVGLPVANRGWYFSGLAMRMATQMSLQKIDAAGRMPQASMMSGPGIESARRAFWNTLLLESLASFASGEPPPITHQDIHVAEPYDSPHEANVSTYISQLALLLIRVARLNGNRHPESAQFSPEYAQLHQEMVDWYHHSLPLPMQIIPSTAADQIQKDPQLFAAKMFLHCHYHAAIIALHQPRVDLVRVEPTKESPDKDTEQWRHLAQQQCLIAACTMTELLTLARQLDVRYHVVTFGFAVFMAGVVHVGAVACTPLQSTERQYSINCVKEHIATLDRLGKYFAFHFIMAKHIRAQLHSVEVKDQRNQDSLAKLAAVALDKPSSSELDSLLDPLLSSNMGQFLDLLGTQPSSPNISAAAQAAATFQQLHPGGLSNISSGISSLMSLFSAPTTLGSSLYPENILIHSTLAPTSESTNHPFI